MILGSGETHQKNFFFISKTFFDPSISKIGKLCVTRAAKIFGNG